MQILHSCRGSQRTAIVRLKAIPMSTFVVAVYAPILQSAEIEKMNSTSSYETFQGIPRRATLHVAATIQKYRVAPFYHSFALFRDLITFYPLSLLIKCTFVISHRPPIQCFCLCELTLYLLNKISLACAHRFRCAALYRFLAGPTINPFRPLTVLSIRNALRQIGRNLSGYLIRHP